MDLDTLESIKEHLSLSHMSKPALVGIVAILVMVAVAAGRLLFIGTATANDFEISKGSQNASASAEAPPAQVEPETLFVHVSGEVVNPGLVEVAAGARVADAVKAAGGFTEDAAPGSVNLARVLSDGEQVVIAHLPSDEPDAPGTAAPASSPSFAQSATTPSSSGLININTATADELVSLPGIGQATASKIIDDRQANGAYKTIEDLKRVSGIGDKKFESIAGLICV